MLVEETGRTPKKVGKETIALSAIVFFYCSSPVVISVERYVLPAKQNSKNVTCRTRMIIDLFGGFKRQINDFYKPLTI
jgi:hypothetical protein